MPKENTEAKVGLNINQDACMGCSLCVREYKELFGMNNKKAYVKEHSFEIDKEKLENSINHWPVNAIEFVEEGISV